MDKAPDSFQWLILFGLQAIGLILLSQLNHTLATISLFLFINGLFLTFPALYLPLGQGIGLVSLFSIFYDSGEPWTLGASLIPNLLIFIIVYHLRNRINHDRREVIKPVVLLINILLFLYYTTLAGLRFAVNSEFVFLNLTHLLLSQITLYIISGWLIAYHKSVLLMFNIDAEATLRATK
jgi:hypothetical protein